MEDVKLDWRTAAVSDAKLTVELEGKPPKGWKASFEKTVKLLGSGDWGEVTLKKDTVTVTEISAGEEDKLRHHLEGVVAQANAALRSEEEHKDAVADDGDGEERAEEGGPDAEMAARFRAFGADSDEADDAEHASRDN
jgi:hypothetical protein